MMMAAADLTHKWLNFGRPETGSRSSSARARTSSVSPQPVRGSARDVTVFLRATNVPVIQGVSGVSDASSIVVGVGEPLEYPGLPEAVVLPASEYASVVDAVGDEFVLVTNRIVVSCE